MKVWLEWMGRWMVSKVNIVNSCCSLEVTSSLVSPSHHRTGPHTGQRSDWSLKCWKRSTQLMSNNLFFMFSVHNNHWVWMGRHHEHHPWETLSLTTTPADNHLPTIRKIHKSYEIKISKIQNECESSFAFKNLFLVSKKSFHTWCVHFSIIICYHIKW